MRTNFNPSHCGLGSSQLHTYLSVKIRDCLQFPIQSPAMPLLPFWLSCMGQQAVPEPHVPITLTLGSLKLRLVSCCEKGEKVPSAFCSFRSAKPTLPRSSLQRGILAHSGSGIAFGSHPHPILHSGKTVPDLLRSSLQRSILASYGPLSAFFFLFLFQDYSSLIIINLTLSI